MTNQLYPLKFKPIFLEKIWGGQKIKTSLGMNFSPLPNCGEAWVLSGVKGMQTKVTNGFLKGNELNEIVEVFMDDLVGEKVFEKYGEEFPILIKFIDSNDYLSIQVHPDDLLAEKRGIGRGKTEMWYIMDADPDARLFTGFNRKMDRETYLHYFNENRLTEILNVENAVKGDLFYIPAGRIHALGPGLLLAEIQQTSDTTYRIFDWNRVDKQGNARELHTDLAIDAIDFGFHENYRTPYTSKPNSTVELIDSSYFTTRMIEIDHPMKKDYSLVDSFVIWLCVEGIAKVSYDGGKVMLGKGETILIPAIMDRIGLHPEGGCKILEVMIS